MGVGRLADAELHERRFPDAGIANGTDGLTLRDNNVFS
jgi:hypothetical protein